MTKGYSTDNYTKWAEEYIRGGHGKDKEKPFYLWLCYGVLNVVTSVFVERAANMKKFDRDFAISEELRVICSAANKQARPIQKKKKQKTKARNITIHKTHKSYYA